MNAHTPGPWNVLPWFSPSGAEITTVQALNRTVADCPGEDETAKANARLISAAPDLLKALEALLSERYACESIILDAEGKPESFDANGMWTCDSPASVASRLAIAKARGEA